MVAMEDRKCSRFFVVEAYLEVLLISSSQECRTKQ